MAIGSGLSAQFGMAAETPGSYGTYVAPTRFLEFAKEELKADYGIHVTRSVGDQFGRSSRSRTFAKGAGGKIEFEIQNKGFGLLLKHALGSGSIAQVGVTTEYQATLTPDASTGETGLMATVQIGRPDVGATVRPFSYVGGKITDWEFASELDKALMLSTTWDFQSEDVGQSLASQSLPSGCTPLIFADAAITIDGSAVAVRGLKVAGKKGLDTDRRFLGAITTKKEPLMAGEYAVTGELDLEFASLTEYNKFVAGTLSKLVATWSYGTITGASNPYKLVITVEKLVYTGETPTVPDSGIIRQKLPFRALWDGTNPLVKVTYSTSDTTL